MLGQQAGIPRQPYRRCVQPVAAIVLMLPLSILVVGEIILPVVPGRGGRQLYRPDGDFLPNTMASAGQAVLPHGLSHITGGVVRFAHTLKVLASGMLA